MRPFVNFRRLFCKSIDITAEKIRNVAIIAHVDHGKTTLVDKILRATNAVDSQDLSERMMDSNALERERGITIVSKCTSVQHRSHRLNLVDTPGHADFGGEVERILKMVDGVLLVVDVAEGPMAQTKFVLAKALRKRLPAIVVLNKVDRNEQRTEDAELEVLELFDELKTLKNYPVCYASAKLGWAINSLGDERISMIPLLDTIIAKIPPPLTTPGAPFRFLVSLLSHDPHLGRILTGRVDSGRMAPGEPLHVLTLTGASKGAAKALRILAHRGLRRETVPEAVAGDIVSLAGLSEATVTDTVCAPGVGEPLSADVIDPPTLEVRLGVNTSPLQGREGAKLTSQKIGEWLEREARSNVAIEVRSAGDGANFAVKGRGELQLGVLMETMRREGFEFEVSAPKILTKKSEDGVFMEPFEKVTIEIDEKHSGVVIEKMTMKKAELIEMVSLDSTGKTKLVFTVPSRTLIGFDSELKNLSRGTAVMNREFKGYEKHKGEVVLERRGSVISLSAGQTTNYSLANVEAKGTLFVGSNTEVYPGMIIGETNCDKDLEVNPIKAKRVSNVRSLGSEEVTKLARHVEMTIERAISYIKDDELVELTPKAIRLRKKILDANLRARAKKQNKNLMR